MKAITIRVDTQDNIAIDFSRSMTSEEVLEVLSKVSAIVYQYGKQLQRQRQTNIKNQKKLARLMNKQKNPELN